MFWTKGSKGGARRHAGTRPAYIPKGYIAAMSKKGRPVRRRRQPKGAFAAKVKAVIRAEAETKHVRETILDSTASGYVNFNSYIDNTTDWYRCIPLISPGVTSAQKVGKVISPRNCTLHLNFKFDSADQYTRDIMVVLYVLTSKTQKSYANTGVNSNLTTGYNTFLDPGDGVNDADFHGNWLSTTYPVNHDAFTLHKKMLIHLGKSSGVANGYGVVGEYDGAGRGMYAPNSMIARRVSVPIKLPSKLLYDQNANTTPTNAAVWFGVGYYYRNGLPGDSGGGILQVDASTEMWYDDE